ncbi:beta-ketoacyl synthase [Candidatus Scalindua japonica]|uniref:Beta-ketoacyl synthase n=1 Tax=Candidatus Scalindua japonica TaxID=1284222 RepID=A0A286TWH7_9BACT|nr:beta-ketoacyl synthase N-terminal-like domain-containing protein [Candidatus Scalindua japonica]GAX60239.1 beta-ketoacyl synthase [Candidatus Scalindua japonica]
MTSGKEIFVQLIKNNNLIVRDHRVHQVRVLPGVTFIDMVYRLAGDYFKTRDLELRNVLFKEPLATSDEFDKKVYVSFTPVESYWKVEIKSQKVRGDDIVDTKFDENMECLLYYYDDRQVAGKEFDPDAFIQDATDQFDMDDIYGMARSLNINHYAFMKTMGTVYQRGSEELMVLTISELAQKFLSRFYLHPAFLDGATFAGASFNIDQGNVLSGPMKLNPYIPFMIKVFRAYKELPDKIYVYSYDNSQLIKNREKKQNDGQPDLIKKNITIYNENGKCLVEFGELVSKQIRHQGLIQRLTESGQKEHGYNNIDLGPEQQTQVQQHIGLESQKEHHQQTLLNGIEDDPMRSAIISDLKGRVATKLNKEPDTISTTTGFYDLGLDSTQLLTIVRELEKKCSHEFYPTLLFEYTNIEDLSGYLLENEAEHFHIDKELDDKEETMSDYIHETESLINQEQEHSKPIPLISGSQTQETENCDIAVIGLAGRYPGASDLWDLWEVVSKGKNCITEVPDDHWKVDGFYSPDFELGRQSISKWGGFINDVDKFDPLFFKISPSEAERLDPQLKLLLETAWHTIEDAGYSLKDLSRYIGGVYVGVMNDDYTWVSAEHYVKSGHYISPGSYAHELANRISYAFNFQGPSFTVETACSSSLTAIHLARLAVMRGDCQIALAGGVNISLHRSKYLMLSGMRILSPEGKEKTFDAKADGYVPGEGVGLVLLKKLENAVADGDHIYGVIKGSAINHSGTGSGKFIPNIKPLEAVVEQSLAEARVHPELLDYVEAHGTGTVLGDPVEIKALANVFQRYTSRKGYCALGSKANIGHLESASGICSLTKVLLSMKFGLVPMCTNIETINPGIPIQTFPFYIPTETRKWPKPAGQRIAAINSFGVGGSNCFMVVSDYEQPIVKSEKKKRQVVVLSARTKEGLSDYARRLREYFVKGDEHRSRFRYTFENMVWTLQVGREAMEHRLAIDVVDEKDMLEKLGAFIEGRSDVSGIYQGYSKEKKVMLWN